MVTTVVCRYGVRITVVTDHRYERIVVVSCYGRDTPCVWSAVRDVRGRVAMSSGSSSSAVTVLSWRESERAAALEAKHVRGSSDRLEGPCRVERMRGVVPESHAASKGPDRNLRSSWRFSMEQGPELRCRRTCLQQPEPSH